MVGLDLACTCDTVRCSIKVYGEITPHIKEKPHSVTVLLLAFVMCTDHVKYLCKLAILARHAECVQDLLHVL